ncbi:hypothetical protein [Salibacterium aidingense]|uniref:hypothetical protein n=1 Tax=Salibacterium aidingense TaxID=384933 RepID=UPI003BC6B78E
MGYITPDYYKNEYKGADAGPELDKYIERTSDAIDQITGFRLMNDNLEAFPEMIQTLVKKATAAQVEFYVMQGGDEAVNAGTKDNGSVSIGSFSYGSSEGDNIRVSPNTLSFLEPTGLLYQGLDVVQHGYYSAHS